MMINITSRNIAKSTVSVRTSKTIYDGLSGHYEMLGVIRHLGLRFPTVDDFLAADAEDPLWLIRLVAIKMYPTLLSRKTPELLLYCNYFNIPSWHIPMNLLKPETLASIIAMIRWLRDGFRLSQMVARSNEVIVLSLIACGIQHDVAHLLSPETLKKITESRNLSLAVVDPPVLERYHKIMSSGKSDMILRLFSNRWGVSTLGINIYDVVRLTAEFTPFEMIIMNLADYNLSELAIKLGMIIPLNVELEPYMTNNLPEYAHVFDRNPNKKLSLNQMTDMEIVAHTGAFVQFNDRFDLLLKQRSLINGEIRWFVPLQRKSVNKETTALTPVIDMATFMIAYGSLTKYTCYELDELRDSFYISDESAEFRDPQNLNHMWSDEEAKQLSQLLDAYPVNSSILQMQQQIVKVIEQKEINRHTDNASIKNFNDMPTESKQRITKILQKIYEAGWYMRRWKGPPNPYPVKATSTTTKVDPAILASPILHLINQELSKFNSAELKCFNMLRVYSYRENKLINDEGKLSVLFRDVVSDKYCIRVASTYFIVTAHVYLTKMVKVDMKGEPHPGLVQSIS